MPRKNKRKSVSRFEEASRKFEDTFRHKADADGLPKSLPRPLPEGEEWLRESAWRLSIWLKEFEKEGDSFSYSMLLQSWLEVNHIPLPKDVFQIESKSLGRGRPPSELGSHALQLYKPKTFGWKKVAQQLVPDSYGVNPINAVKHIRDLAETAKKSQAQDNAFNKATPFDFLMLGFGGLPEIAAKNSRHSILCVALIA
jgi:hypothetical protein